MDKNLLLVLGGLGVAGVAFAMAKKKPEQKNGAVVPTVPVSPIGVPMFTEEQVQAAAPVIQPPVTTPPPQLSFDEVMKQKGYLSSLEKIQYDARQSGTPMAIKLRSHIRQNFYKCDSGEDWNDQSDSCWNNYAIKVFESVPEFNTAYRLKPFWLPKEKVPSSN